MISSSNEAPSTRDLLEDQYLSFKCYQFSRGVRATRPLARRWVSAERCLCTRDTTELKICDLSRLYEIYFNETSDEEAANQKKRISESYPDIQPERIGVFNPDGDMSPVYVPPHFMDALWSAATAADGVLRSIELSVQPQKSGGWAIFEATLKEEIAEPFELPLDKQSNPKVGPPRSNPVVAELRQQLRLRWSRVVPGIITIAIGVLLALWIAKLWR